MCKQTQTCGKGCGGRVRIHCSVSTLRALLPVSGESGQPTKSGSAMGRPTSPLPAASSLRAKSLDVSPSAEVRERKKLQEGSMNGFVTLAERLIPLICELRHTTESDRRIAEPIVQAIRESNLC